MLVALLELALALPELLPEVLRRRHALLRGVVVGAHHRHVPLARGARRPRERDGVPPGRAELAARELRRVRLRPQRHGAPVARRPGEAQEGALGMLEMTEDRNGSRGEVQRFDDLLAASDPGGDDSDDGSGIVDQMPVRRNGESVDDYVLRCTEALERAALEEFEN